MANLSAKPAVTARMRIAEHRYQLMVDSMSDYAIFMLDAAGRIISWNPGAERVSGYRADEIIGCHVECFYTCTDREEGLPRRELEIAKTEGRCESENWRIRKDGSHYWAQVLTDPVRDERGTL